MAPKATELVSNRYSKCWRHIDVCSVITQVWIGNAKLRFRLAVLKAQRLVPTFAQLGNRVGCDCSKFLETSTRLLQRNY
jgi:hypothetical protein